VGTETPAAQEKELVMTNARTPWQIASRCNGRAALAVFLVLGLLAAMDNGPARAEDDRAWRARIDLGLDVSAVEKTAGGVRAFLAELSPHTQRVVLNACEQYVERPGAIIGPDTLAFCNLAVGKEDGAAVRF
jgi:hypothetical protein